MGGPRATRLTDELAVRTVERNSLETRRHIVVFAFLFARFQKREVSFCSGNRQGGEIENESL